jgi:hypothetical protein
MSNGHDASRSHFKLKSIYILTIVATTIDDDCLKLPALQCQIEHWRLMVSIFGENTAALRRDGSPPHRQSSACVKKSDEAGVVCTPASAISEQGRLEGPREVQSLVWGQKGADA